MSYRFVKITTFYRDYLSYFYTNNKDVINLSYDEQYKKIMYDSFGWADFFQTNLSQLGVDAYEIIYNATSLQKAWANEHSIDLEGKELLIEQLKAIKPDIVFFQDSNNFNGAWIDFLRTKVPSIKHIIGWCCSPFTHDQLTLYKNFDYMITCSQLFANKFKDYGLKAYILPHAFEKSILKKINIDGSNPQADFLFIGSLIASDDFHNFRTKIIENLLDSGINLELYSKLLIDDPLLLFLKQSSFLLSKILIKTGFQNYIMNHKILRKVALLNELPRNPKYSVKLKAITKEPIYGLEMFSRISNSKMTLNIHGGVAGDFAANIRLFEVTGVGSCLITDWKKNLNEFFEIDNEVVAFKTGDECIEKVNWLLDNPTERRKIAKAGQQRVLKDHNFAVRARKLDEIIRAEMNHKNKQLK